jgi:MFS family permease
MNIVKIPFLSCFSAALFFLYSIFQMTVFNASSDHLIHSFGFSQIMLGNVSSLYFYCAALSYIPYGLLLDHYPTRFPALIAIFLCTLSVALLAFLPSLFTISLYRALCGFTNALIFLVCMRQAVVWFPKKTSLIISLIITIGMIGGLLQYPFSIVIAHFSWQVALFADASFGLLLCIIGMISLKDPPASLTISREALTLKKLLQHLKSVFTVKENWLGGFFTACLNLPVMVLAAAWGNQYIMANKNVSASEASFVISMIFLGMIFASPFFGWFTDFIQSRKKAMLLGTLGSLISIFVIILFHPSQILWLAVLFFLLGFFCTVQIVSYTIVNEINAPSKASTAMSFVSILIFVIGGLANLIFASISAAFMHAGYAMTFATQMSMLFLPAAFFLALLSIFFLKETYGYSHE